MSITQGAGYVESIREDGTATTGQLEEVKRKASANAITLKETVAAAEAEAVVEEGAASEARQKEAGAEQSTKLAQGNVEGRFAEEAVTNMAPAAGIASNLLTAMQESKSNPSNAGDVAKAQKAGLTSANAKSFEDGFAAIKKAPITTKVGRSFSEKGSVLSASMESLTKDTKGITESGAATAQLKTGAIKQVMEQTYSHGLANEKVLAQVAKLEQQGVAPSPGGMGSTSTPNNMTQLALNQRAPTGPTHISEEDGALG